SPAHCSSSALRHIFCVSLGLVPAFASLTNFFTVEDATRKLKPWTLSRLPNVVRPITSPRRLIPGPPELPCVIGVVTWSTGSPSVARLIADTGPAVIDGSSGGLLSHRPSKSPAPGQPLAIAGDTRAILLS